MIRLRATSQRVLVTDLPYGRTQVEEHLLTEDGEVVILKREYDRGRFQDYCYALGVTTKHYAMGRPRKIA